MGALSLIAFYGDRGLRAAERLRPHIYVLSLGVYCSSWAFYGAVGFSARSGPDFLPLYLGPALLLAAGWPLLRLIVRISRRHNITSLADFISARYGKSQTLGALVAAVALIGVTPCLSMQLKAVSLSLQTIMPEVAGAPGLLVSSSAGDEMAMLAAAVMAGFAMLFGARRQDATEHQDGLILAIAADSVLKLTVFVAAGLFALLALTGGPSAPPEGAAAAALSVLRFPGGEADIPRWLTLGGLSAFAFLLLPRQFHVAVVENTDEGDVRRAAFAFPLYLLVMALFVIPQAAAGAHLSAGGADPDARVLALPLLAGRPFLSLAVFLGGLSAAMAMMIMETVALAVMVCNNIVMPLVISRSATADAPGENMGGTLILVRRLSIAAILLLAYGYYHLAGAAEALVQTGLLSFAAVAQFAPALLGGLFWRRATAAGAAAGILTGFAVWVWMLLLPSFSGSGWFSFSFAPVSGGASGLEMLHPRLFMGLRMDPLAHGTLWSLGLNVLAWAGVSLLTRLSPAEKMQAAAFLSERPPAASPSFRLAHTSVSVAQLQATVARYLGEERARRSFAEFARREGVELDGAREADIRMLRFAERLLASAVGAASSRLALSLLLEKVTASRRGALRLLDDASAAIQYNRDLLQSAIDHVRQGIGVFDRDFRLICWNRQFRHLLRLPPEMGRVGAPLEAIMRTLLQAAGPARATPEALAERLACVTERFEPFQERFGADGTVLEARSSRMPDGGVVITFADITRRVQAAEALQMANELLEKRVEERTAELTRLNRELEQAKAEAEKANLDKTRFIAAASHDILQPLNAARLFTSAMVEHPEDGLDLTLVRNIDASLESVEEILTALLDISRFDAGARKPEYSSFTLNDILLPLGREFSAMAEAKGLRLRTAPCSLWVRSDRRLLRRLLQNLLSNAIKYTPSGKVLIGCRRRGRHVRVCVCDTGPGIPPDKREIIFREFERLRENAGKEPGLGLGLSIVERISRVLGCDISLESVPGRGTAFSIMLPLAGEQPESLVQAAPLRGAETLAQPGPVLVVDNEESILEGMSRLLGGWGCEVLPASGGAAASGVLRRRGAAISLIIADYHLDDEEGLDVIAALRRQAGWRVPAILITADRTAEVKEKARREDVVYLKKPVKPAALRAVMNRLCLLVPRPPRGRPPAA